MNSILGGDAIFVGQCSSVQYRYHPRLPRWSLRTICLLGSREFLATASQLGTDLAQTGTLSSSTCALVLQAHLLAQSVFPITALWLAKPLDAPITYQYRPVYSVFPDILLVSLVVRCPLRQL